jgi:hypothetical protein
MPMAASSFVSQRYAKSVARAGGQKSIAGPGYSRRFPPIRRADTTEPTSQTTESEGSRSGSLRVASGRPWFRHQMT